MYLSVFLPLNCNIRQLVGCFSFLIRKPTICKDYSASERRKLNVIIQTFSIDFDILLMTLWNVARSSLVSYFLQLILVKRMAIIKE